MGLDDQHGVWRTAEPRPPPGRSGDRAPGQYPVSGRSGLAGSVGSVPGVSQCRATPREFAPAVVGPRSHQRSWLSQGVAAVYTGDGSGIDRPCMVAARGVVLPGAAVAPGTDGLKQDAG